MAQGTARDFHLSSFSSSRDEAASVGSPAHPHWLTTHNTMIHISRTVELLRQTRLWWITPPLIMIPLALLAAVVKPTVWKAYQTVVIRDQAIGEGSSGRAGRFGSTEELKAAQESVLQFARSNQVLSQALQQVGPWRPSKTAWPSGDDVQELREKMTIGTPKGSDLGTTDMLQVSVSAETADRAVELTAAVVANLQREIQTFRSTQSGSLVAELSQEVATATAQLESANAKLQQMEAQLGADLGEMRTLSAGQAGESNLRTSLSQIDGEIRQAFAARSQLVKQRELFQQASEQPHVVLSAPNALLETHLGVRSLQTALAEARVRAANRTAHMTPAHPQLRLAQKSVEHIERELAAEILQAAATTETELSINRELIKSLHEEREKVAEKLDLLANNRSAYDQAVSQTTQATERLNQAQSNLAIAEAAHNAARLSTQITPTAPPEPGLRPEGPGRFLILLAGIMASFLTSAGLVVLVTPIEQLLSIIQLPVVQLQPAQSLPPTWPAHYGSNPNVAVPAGVGMSGTGMPGAGMPGTGMPGAGMPGAGMSGAGGNGVTGPGSTVSVPAASVYAPSGVALSVSTAAYSHIPAAYPSEAAGPSAGANASAGASASAGTSASVAASGVGSPSTWPVTNFWQPNTTYVNAYANVETLA